MDMNTKTLQFMEDPGRSWHCAIEKKHSMSIIHSSPRTAEYPAHC